MANRDVSLDIMKGIGIIAVIIGHINDVPYMPFRHFCFSFHMPLFFLLAGYLHKVNYDQMGYIKKSADRLLKPYLAAALVLLLYSCYLTFAKNHYLEIPKQLAATFFASGGYHHSLILAKFRPIGAIWFLVGLFWCRVLFNFLAYKVSNYYHICIIIAILATMLDYYVINLSFAILPGLSALMFYSIGHYFKTHHIPMWAKVLTVITWPVSFYFCKIYMVTCTYQMYPLAVLGACGGTLIIYIISKKIINNIVAFSIIFSWLGRMSMVILCWHMIETLCKLYVHSGLPTDLIIQLPIRLIVPILLSYGCMKIKLTRDIFQLQ